MGDIVTRSSAIPQPQMLRVAFTLDPQNLGEADRRRAVGQMFEAALDRCGLTKQCAAAAMGYTDAGVIGRWVSGMERVQVDKCALLGDRFMAFFAVALVEWRPDVQVDLTIRIPDRRSA